MTALIVPHPVLAATRRDTFSSIRENVISGHGWRVADPNLKYSLRLESLEPEDLDDLGRAAGICGDARFAKTLASVLEPSSGGTWKVPSFGAFAVILSEWIAANATDGLLWQEGSDGVPQPFAVGSVRFAGDERKGDKPHVVINGHYHGINRGYRYGKDDSVLTDRYESWTFLPSDVTSRRVPSILAARGIRASDDETVIAHERALREMDEAIASGPGTLFRAVGRAVRVGDGNRDDPSAVIGHRVVFDTDPSSQGPGTTTCHPLKCEIDIPRHSVATFFDLSLDRDARISMDRVRRHVYDKSLRDSLILPEMNADMLDVLTSDVEALTQDVVEGKSAGNIILARGPAGTGKTLTAEIYAEIMEKPLYRVHAGTLGVSASSVSDGLGLVFARAARWNCAVLIDEADVFVMRRGDDIARNAVTAEFLRVLEYHPSLIFMTTNRSDDVDDAILSRCAAVITYEAPNRVDAARIWRRHADNFGIAIGDDLIETMIGLWPRATGRDVRNVLRLGARYAAMREPGSVPGLDAFRKAAMFRGVPLGQETARG